MTSLYKYYAPCLVLVKYCVCQKSRPLWQWGRWVHWIVFITSTYRYYDPCFVLVEHSVCHEPVSGIINVHMLLA